MALHPGDSLENGKYRILRQLGRGGFGFVYLAEDTLLHEQVAIKELIPALVGDDATLRRFLAEARSTMRLTHDRIVHTHNLFAEGGNYYIVMEYMPGGSLEAWLAARGVVPVPEAVQIASDIADGLAYAHARGIVHCDLKPANILFTTSGPNSTRRAKIADFGIAHVSGDASSRTWMTPAGFVAGTLPYMSPEQADGVRDDPRIDVYALGAVLYRMLTGRPYLEFDELETPGAQADNVHRIRNEPVTLPSVHNRAVPPWLDAVVLTALRKQPAERYASANAMQAALLHGARSGGMPPEGAGAVEAGLAASQPRPGRSATPPPSPRSRLWFWPAVAAGGVLLAVLAVIFSLAGPGGEAVTQPTATTSAVAAVSAPSTDAPTPAGSAPATALDTPATSVGGAPLPVTVTPSTVAPPAGSIKVAILTPLTGPVPAYGVMTRNGALLAIKEWNASGGAAQRQIEPIVEDGGCTAGPATKAANKVIDQDQVRYIVGEVCSQASIPVSEIANERKVVHISPASTNPAITLNADGTTKKYVFRACFVDTFQGVLGAGFAVNTLGMRNAFVLYDPSNIYSSSLAEYFEQGFVEGGGQLAGKETYEASDTDFSAILARVVAAKPDMIYLPDYSNIVNLVTKQAKDMGIEIPFVGGDGWDASDLDLQAAAGSYFTTHFAPDDPRPRVQDFVTHFKAEYGGAEPDALAALAYDATNLLLQSIDGASVDDVDAVSDYLATIRFEGVTGQLAFDARHNPRKQAVVLAVHPNGVKFQQLVSP